MFGVAFIVGNMLRFNYNSSYGGATKDLVDTTIAQIEDGRLDRVISVLRRLKLDYKPTYENRAHYDDLVRDAVEQMRGQAELRGTKFDTSAFTGDSWIGHWENDTGFWLIITQLGDLQITRSGDNLPKMEKVVVADDFSSLSFVEGDHWRHELKLVNKYEAIHTWRDLRNDTVWRSSTLYKLIRTTPEQRAYTQQIVQ